MGSNYVDLSGVYRRIEDVRAEVRSAVREITHEVNALHQESMREIEYLQQQLVEMERNARLRDALQRALTEIIRVRQELENKFGSHKLVREYMLGILQANDLGLITKSTISKCTEELMISAPGYWLAPALIALAGWIGDNKTLANRALKVAMERDEEKTSLLFALITRRVNAGRIQSGKEGTDVSFQWLNRYFSLQDPTNMKESVVAYLDAYTNGVFGEDKDHICSDHINNWIKVLMDKNPDFEKDQKDYWVNNFNGFCRNMEGEKYAALETFCPQYPQINAYLSKINAAERDNGVKDTILDIVHQEVDRKKLVESIDNQLMKLVKQYDEKEAPLRDEEQYLELVKKYEGDEEAAQAELNNIRAGRQDESVDFVQRLNEAILNPNTDGSSKKTAIYLLQNYINAAFEEFVSADKESYPEEIDLQLEVNPQRLPYATPFKWSGKTVNSENRDELVNSLAKKYDEAKAASLAKISDEKGNSTKKTGTIVTIILAIVAVVGIALLIIGGAAKVGVLTPIGVIVMIIGIIGFVIGLVVRNNGVKALRQNDRDRQNINGFYDKFKKINVQQLNNALDARVEANQTVEDFDKVRETQGAIVSL